MSFVSYSIPIIAFLETRGSIYCCTYSLCSRSCRLISQELVHFKNIVSSRKKYSKCLVTIGISETFLLKSAIFLLISWHIWADDHGSFLVSYIHRYFNSSPPPPGPNGRHFSDDIFRCKSLMKMFMFWLQFHHYLNQCWPDSIAHICCARERWVNGWVCHRIVL